MAAEPFTLTAALVLPPDTGQPNETLDYSFGGTFNSASRQKLELSGSATHNVGFGTIPAAGAKAVFLEYENLSASNAVVQVAFNGGDPIPISPGGFLGYVNPVPASGITAMTIVHTTSCTIRLTLLG